LVNDSVKTGTTTLAIKCKDGIVTAADKRATAGGMVVMRDVEKVVPINERIVLTISGSVSDAQLLIKYIRAELKLNSLRVKRLNTVRESANMLGSIVYSGVRQMVPSITHFLISGQDEGGYHIYEVFVDGSVSEVSEFVSSGSGSVFAYGLLEGGFKKDMTIDEGIVLAKKALNSALLRDTASGNGADIYTVTSEGIQKKETILINTGIDV
jgi:proteasome beta subunit